MVHFGVYSLAGGVWNGQRVSSGYSEQIRAFAGVGRDEYRRFASGFCPQRWDAEAVVALAKRGGMRSVVLTAKHHDGFNMFATAASEFSSTRALGDGCARDVVAELAAACRRGGLKFGVYYSLIDWDHAAATPPDRHGANDNEVPPAHERLNVAQVRELLDGRYGNVSELWFDMGRPSARHSGELVELVHALQPGCLVSGRVWNHRGDFASLPDNRHDDGGAAPDRPWQTVSSVFDNTWGHRSWQLVGVADVAQLQRSKIAEHVDRLLRVVARGGNALLNVGPRGDGSIDDFEAAVVAGVGRFVRCHGEALFGTRAGPLVRDTTGAALPATLHSSGRRVYVFLPRSTINRNDRLSLVGLRGVVRSAHLLHSCNNAEAAINSHQNNNVEAAINSHQNNNVEAAINSHQNNNVEAAINSHQNNNDNVELKITAPLSIDVSAAAGRQCEWGYCAVAVELARGAELVPRPLVETSDSDGSVRFAVPDSCQLVYSYNGRGYYDAPVPRALRCCFAGARAHVYRLHGLADNDQLRLSVDGRPVTERAVYVANTTAYHCLTVAQPVAGDPLPYHRFPVLTLSPFIRLN